MAENKKTLMKAAISLIISICVISACVLSVFGYTAREKKLTGEYSLPKDFASNNDLVSNEQHQRKFSIYTHTNKTDEKRIVTLYSTSQINEINRQRENGEWFYLTDAEVLYLISDTVSLFMKYDNVFIVDIRGVVHTYNARPLLKDDVCEAIALRLEVLCSAFYKINNGEDVEYFLMNEYTRSPYHNFLNEKYRLVKGFYFEGYSVSESTKILQASLKRTQGSAFIIKDNGVYYIDELSRAERTDLVSAY